MPFITEELYQRLPRTTLKYPSICVSPYPDEKECPWKNEDIDKDVDFAQKVIKCIRSNRSTYNLPNKIKTDVYIECSSDELKTRLQKYNSLISTLAYSNVLEGKPPLGCTIITVTDKLQVHLLLKGLIDPQIESAKLGKKKELLTSTILKLKQAISANDYTTKVPVDVQKANSEKLENSEGELERLAEAMEALRLMM